MNYSQYRLFDAITYQLDNAPKENMFNAKIHGAWKSYSTREVADIANQLSAALLQKGVSANNFTAEGSDKIAIISNNRPEWLFVDFAVQQIGAILVPIYPTTNASELEYILNESETKYIFAGDKELFEKVKNISVSSLQGIYTFDELEGVASFNSLLSTATAEFIQQVEAIKKQIPNTHTATIIYTSGTTGKPKGVMLSHQNIINNVFNSKTSFPFPDQPEAKALSFLPLNHIFEKTVTYIYLFSLMSIYYAENLVTIAENLREIKPNGFSTVPRLLEKVYDNIMSKGLALKGFKKALFLWSVSLGFKYDNRKKANPFYAWQLSIARKLIFSKWREALGGNIEFIVTGGAAASPKLIRLFHAAEIPVYEGYGPTEHSPVIAVNRKDNKDIYFGTVGPTLDNVEVQLATDGEIMVKSASVMQGYYKQPELTNEVIKDGWLYTGDVGVWIENRFLKITDRKKELFKTSGGKYVAPQPIENKLKESRYIEQIIVVGNDKKFVGALIVPSFAAIKSWLQEHHHQSENIANEDLIKIKEVIQLFRSVVAHYNKQFNQVEQIKKFELLPEEWTIQSGEISHKLSIKRKFILEKYKNIIEKIYA